MKAICEPSVKYCLTSESKNMYGIRMFRIQAKKTFECHGIAVFAGELGGWVESENNLSQDGSCWIFDNATAYEQSVVSGNAMMTGNSQAYGHSSVSENSVLTDRSKIFERASIYGNAEMTGDTCAFGQAEIFGSALLIERAKASGNAWVYKDAICGGNANLTSKVTETPVVIQGLRYIVTIMDDSMSVDCMSHTFEEWRNIDKRELLRWDGKEALRFYEKYHSLIEMTIDTTRKAETNQ